MAPILGPMTKPRTAQVLNVAVYSILTDGATAADRYAAEVQVDPSMYGIG